MSSDNVRPLRVKACRFLSKEALGVITQARPDLAEKMVANRLHVYLPRSENGADTVNVRWDRADWRIVVFNWLEENSTDHIFAEEFEDSSIIFWFASESEMVAFKLLFDGLIHKI